MSTDHTPSLGTREQRCPSRRHCEERSDEAAQSRSFDRRSESYGLLPFGFNGEGVATGAFEPVLAIVRSKGTVPAPRMPI